MRKHRWPLALVISFAVIASLSGVPAANSDFDTTCNSYDNSHVNIQDGYGGYCGGSGGVCAECSTGWSSGYSVCVSDSWGGSMCTDYQY